MILKFDYEKTKEHERELASCAKMMEGPEREELERCSTAEEYYRRYFSLAIGAEFARTVGGVLQGKGPLSILDVGAGRGETSIYLAERGHAVHVVEPSYEFCSVIQAMAEKLDKKLVLYNCIAEYLDNIDKTFDLVIFNVSLHHCDDPVLALTNSYKRLKPGGTLIVVNEPMLPFFRSHEAHLAYLEKFPEETGHYGGNEHSYHFPEYLTMIKQAGFKSVRSTLHMRHTTHRILEQSLIDDPNKARLRQLVKKSYFNCAFVLTKVPIVSIPFVALMKRLSLFQVAFVATK